MWCALYFYGVIMAKDPAILRKRFCKHVIKKWTMNEHPPQQISAVYVLVSFDSIKNTHNICYVGSTVNMFLRYKSHKIPEKIQKEGHLSILFYLQMEQGFYDFERKLIKKLQPKYNRQHK